MSKLFFIIFIFCTSITYGFSASRTQNYIGQATQKELWNDPAWIKLGHYEKGFFSYSSPFNNGFFLSDEGLKSPQKELIKTLELLFSDNTDKTSNNNPDKHLQCKYLARRKWLLKSLDISTEDVMPCDYITKWKKELNVQSVALIFAAADMGNTSSSFGHTFLKIINPENAKNKDLIDYGINYAANADSSEGLFYAVKGLFGLYSGQFTMLPYHQKIREYINLEGRDIWEYYLNLNADEVDTLVDHLIEMETARAPYYFFSDNCSYQVLRSLEVVRPQIDLADHFKYFVIPIDTVKKVNSLSNDPDRKIVDSIKYKKALKTDYLQSYGHLDFLQKKALNVAVDKFKIPDDYELTPIEKAHVYETAMKYYSIKAFRSQKDFEDEKYKLYLERVSLGAITTENGNENTEPPEKSHDSSALYLGFGTYDKLNFSSLKFRNALHDLEQQDFGTVPFSHNEMASIELRYSINTNSSQSTSPSSQSNEKFPENLQIYKFTFLNLVNLNPVTQLDTPFSWKVSASLMYPWKPDFEFAGGYSYDWNLFKRTRVGYFISGKTMSDYNRDGDYKYLTGVGPNVLFISRLTENLGLSIDLSYHFNYLNDGFFRYKSKINYSLKQNFDFQLQIENHYNEKNEIQGQLVWNFIL